MSEPDYSGLVPDRVPNWLQQMIRKSKGRDLSKFSLLDEFYKHTDSIRSDHFDRRHYEAVLDAASGLRDLANERYADDPTWQELIQDEYLALYKAMPHERNPAEMKPTHRINWQAMHHAMETHEWNELRTYTELDQWAAAMAAVEFGTRLGEIFDEMKDLQDMQKDLVAKDQQVQSLIDQLQDLDPNTEMSSAEQLLDQLEEALNDYGNAIASLDQSLSEHGSQLRQAAKSAAQTAKESAENVDGLLQTFGTNPGELRRMPHEARLALAARIANNRKLRDLADKIGRFVRLALGEQARKIVHGRDEVHDIELGDDIHRVLPSELSNLADPDTEFLFLEKYAERKLLQYQLRGMERVARGAIICMIDSSGSMHGAKETWAKAFAIALLNIASKQNRDFYGIIFSSKHDPLMEWYFPKGVGAIDQVLDFCEYEYGGGTDFELPLSRGIEVLEKQFNDDSAQKGDLVLITDGECVVSDEWRDRFFNARNQLAFRLYSCLIGVHSRTLDVLSDQVFNILQLTKADDAADIFGYV